MIDHLTTKLFKKAGHTGLDIRHIIVKVYPYVEIVNGKPKQAHKVYIGSNNGNYEASIPTDFIFMSASKNWAFHEFELAGKNWPGLAIFPFDVDFSVSFADPNQLSVLLHDDCNIFYTHRYQIVMRNTITGELATCDPDASNSDGDLSDGN